MTKDAHDVIRYMMHTEKWAQPIKRGALEPLTKYQFCVARDANKIEIRRALEEIYKVKVASVNTMIVYGKWRKVRLVSGLTSEWKKAIVTLKSGERIETK